MSGSVASRRGPRPRRSLSVALYLLVAVCSTAPCWAAQVITRAELRSQPDRTILALASDDGKPLRITSFPLADPPRLVFDLPGVQLDPELPLSLPVESARLKGFRLGQFSLGPDVARVVLDLGEDASAPVWEVTPGEEGETLIVLKEPGLPALGRPEVTRAEGALLVRLSGAGSLERRSGTLQDPPRIFVDVVGAVIEEPVEEDRDEAPLCRLRMGQQPSEDCRPVGRIVLELAKPQAYSVFSDGNDLVIATGPNSWGLPLPEYAAAGRLKGRKIVVDPGHGGDDVGAPATFGPPPQGPYEKDIVLDIGQRLARLLRAEGAEVTLTRDDDTYIALSERAATANRLKADALISLHCNSCDDPNTLRGTSVYFDHAHSARFAKLVQSELIDALGTSDKGVRNANFAVIRRTKGPGILIETAYINNASDRERLVHPNFRERTARAIVKGLAEFLSGKGRDG
jgi:N-acetylmuramoyl-L-alanine amidase